MPHGTAASPDIQDNPRSIAPLWKSLSSSRRSSRLRLRHRAALANCSTTSTTSNAGAQPGRPGMNVADSFATPNPEPSSTVSNDARGARFATEWRQDPIRCTNPGTPSACFRYRESRARWRLRTQQRAPARSARAPGELLRRTPIARQPHPGSEAVPVPGALSLPPVF